MLLSTLLLMSVACPVQDPPVAPARQESQDGAAAESAPAADVPTETPENVRSFLSEAQSHLYDPQAAGLKALAFDMDVDFPGLGHVGAVHVSWEAGQSAQTAFTADAATPLPANVPPGVMEQQSSAMAQQLLGSMLNRPIASLLDAGVATMAGVQEGLVAVSHYHPIAAQQGVKSQVYLFDEDGRLQKSSTELEQQGMTFAIVQTYAWKPAAEGTDLLVPEAQSVEAKIGPMTQSSKASFTYTQIGPIVLPIRIATTTSGPMSGEQIMAAKNLVVNGQAAPTPEGDPAAPRMPAGG